MNGPDNYPDLNALYHTSTQNAQNNMRDTSIERYTVKQKQKILLCQFLYISCFRSLSLRPKKMRFLSGVPLLIFAVRKWSILGVFSLDQFSWINKSVTNVPMYLKLIRYLAMLIMNKHNKFEVDIYIIYEVISFQKNKKITREFASLAFLHFWDPITSIPFLDWGCNWYKPRVQLVVYCYIEFCKSGSTISAFLTLSKSLQNSGEFVNLDPPPIQRGISQ